MKLLSKTTLLIVTASILLFMVGNLFFFYLSKSLIKKHIDNELISEMHRVMVDLRQDYSLEGLEKYNNELIIKSVAPDFTQNIVFKDTVFFSDIHQRFIPHRALKFNYKTDEGNKLFIIYKSLLSSDKLIERITLATIIMVMVFIIIIYVLNRYIFVNVWADFFKTLKKIENHDIKSTRVLELNPSEIEEFNDLNAVLKRMVDRIQNDYRVLKELTGNTSHEIQTPLAIIKNKAEVLLQSQHLNEQEMTDVYSILNTANRLSKLNQSLLLITKIENNQFDNTEPIRVKEAVQKILDNFEILVQSGGFTIHKRMQNQLIYMNPVLFDVLMTNLFKNAMVHGKNDEPIEVIFEDYKFSVSNGGEELPFDSGKLFTRFVKGTTSKNSSGIGLEIVKKICNLYSIAVNYSYKNGRHFFSVDFTDVAQQ